MDNVCVLVVAVPIDNGAGYVLDVAEVVSEGEHNGRRTHHEMENRGLTTHRTVQVSVRYNLRFCILSDRIDYPYSGEYIDQLGDNTNLHCDECLADCIEAAKAFAYPDAYSMTQKMQEEAKNDEIARKMISVIRRS